MQKRVWVSEWVVTSSQESRNPSTSTSLGVAKAGNLKLNFVAKSIGIHFFGFEDIFRCYRDHENLKQHFGRMDTLKEKFQYQNQRLSARYIPL